MPNQDGVSTNGHSENGYSPANQPQNGHNGNGRSSLPVNWDPLRVSILEILGIDGGRVLSPSDLSRELQIPLSNTNYHVTELAKSGLIELVRERQVRGATEHFYRLPGTVTRGGKATEEAVEESEPAWAMA